MITRSKGLTIAGSSLLVASALVGPSLAAPAFAASSCIAPAIAISNTVCEISLTGEGTFVPNSSMLKVEALLIAGGGSTGGYATYGGDGGEVQIIELNNHEDVTYTVGVGGVAPDGLGGDTEINQGIVPNSASGGEPGVNTSGTGAPGVVLSSLTSTLFLDSSECVAGQGTTYSYDGGTGTGATSASCGASYYTNLTSNTPTQLDPNVYIPDTGSATIVSQTANSGAGGSAWPSFGSSGTRVDFNQQDGADGVLRIRWSHVADLPDTGASQNGFTATMGVAVAATMAVAGAGMLVAARRRKA